MQSEAEAMLLDRYLPQYDVTETHAVIIDAGTGLTWQAVRRSDLSRSAVIRVLLELRSLPNRLQRVLKRRPPGPGRPPLTLDDMERAGFLLLGESRGHEIVFGTVVQPWKAVTDEEPAPRVESGRFAASGTPGYVKVAFNIRVEPYGSERALITTETRTAATPRQPPPLRPLLAARWAVQRADPPTDAADREIRCRATTWPHEHYPPTRRVSLAGRRGRPGGRRIGIGSPGPGTTRSPGPPPAT